MNTNFEKFVYPAFQQRHKISVETDGIVVIKPANEIPNNSTKQIKKRIEVKPQNITLIDEYVGRNGSLSKVKLNDGTICFIEQFLVEKLSIETKNSFPPSLLQENLDSPTAPKIDWRDQKVNTVFEDPKNGNVCISYEFPDIITFDENNKLENKIKEAHLLGTIAILKNFGIKHDEEYVKNIFDSYYIFSRAQEYYMEARNCSTLKVLLTLPKKYLFSNILEKFTGAIDQKDPSIAATQPEQKTTYKVITFNNYSNYYLFFNSLEKYLRRLNQIYEAKKDWIIEPQSIFLNLNNEANKIKEFFDNVNNLLALNFPRSFYTFTSPNTFIWYGKLEFTIDEKNLQIVQIKFFPDNPFAKSSDELINSLASTNDNLVDKPLNINILNFLQDPIITNKTTINYLLKFELSKYLKDISITDETAKAIRFLTIGGILVDIVNVFFGQDEETLMATFLTDTHYPIIYSIEAPDLDILGCISKTSDRTKRLARNKLADQKVVYEELKKRAEDQRPFLEADVFSKSLRNLDIVKDQNIALLTGRRKPVATEPVDQFLEFIEAARAVDLFRFLKEAALCVIKKVSPESYRDLIKTFKNARKELEKLLSATICNPVLDKVLGTIEAFQLPEIATYDPNKSLSDALAKYVQQLLNDLIAEAIKQALTIAAKACLDSSPSSNPPNTNTPDLLDGLDSNAGLNDPAINDLLSDLLDGLKDESGNIIDQARLDALNNLKNVLDDVSKCLTPQELCKLMKGQTLNNDVYDIIASLLKRKFKGKEASILYKLNDKVYLTNFFKTLGSVLDLTICDFENDPLPTNKNPLCADETFENARKEILKNKNLSDDAVEALLNDIKEKDKQNLEDLLSFLDSDNPIDNSKLPDILCAKLPDGETIAPTVKAFSQLNDSLYKNIYTSFDTDALEWYTSTYTVDKKRLNLFKFSQDTNYRLRPDFSTLTGDTSNTDSNKAFSTANSEPNEANINDALTKSKDYQETKILNYLYNFTNTDITIDENKNSFNTILDGFKQQEKDINVIDSTYRENVEIAEIAATKFIKTFLLQLDTTIANDNAISNALRSVTGISFVEMTLLLATYIKSSTAETNDPNELKDLLNLLEQKLRLDNAFFANAEGIPIYLRVMSYIKENKSAIENLINTITSSNQTISTQAAAGAENQVVTDFSNTLIGDTDSLNIGNQVEERLKSLLDNALAQYEIIQKYYEAVNNLKISYPKYEINFITGIDSLQFPYYDSKIIQYFNNSNKKPNKLDIEIYRNGDVYDISFLNIKKNGKDHINIFNSDKLDDEIKNYIEQQIQFNFQNYFSNSVSFIKPVVELPTISVTKTSLLLNDNTVEQTNNLISEETTVEQISNNTKNIKRDLFTQFINSKINNNINNIVFSGQINNNGLLSIFTDNPIIKTNILQNIQNYSNQIFSQVNSNLYKEIVNLSKQKSKFNKFIESFESTSERPDFSSGQTFNASDTSTSLTGTPTTKYLSLVLEPTLHEKLCNKIPHFLDIDSIKEEMANKKQSNSCVDNFINDKINKNEPINTNELNEQDNTESQNIMLDGSLKLALRIHLTDIVLRSSIIYGYFDPQINRDESLFIDYIADILESELRGEDSLFLNLYLDHAFKQYIKNNKQYISNPTKDNIQKRKLFREAINIELREFVLPKLAKRIDKDTNLDIIRKYGANDDLLVNFTSVYSLLEPLEINSENTWNNYFEISNGGVYFKFSLRNNLVDTFLVRIFNSNFTSPRDIWNEFRNSTEYKFLFKYIFPIEKYFSHNFIIANLATGTKKQFIQPFKTTKTSVRRLCKLIKSRGQTITPDPNSAQDLFNLDPLELIRSFIINALIKAPLKIFKGYVETSEPNIAVASGVYKAIKVFSNDVPDVIIPAMSIGMALPIYSGAPLIPYFNYLNTGLYFGLGLWAEEKEEKKNNNSTDAINNIFNNQVNCDTLPKRDLVPKNNEKFYSAAGSTVALTAAGSKAISFKEEARKMLEEHRVRNNVLITIEQYNANNQIVNFYQDSNLSEDLLILLQKPAYETTNIFGDKIFIKYEGAEQLLNLWTKINKPILKDWYKENYDQYLIRYINFTSSEEASSIIDFQQLHLTQEYKDNTTIKINNLKTKINQLNQEKQILLTPLDTDTETYTQEYINQRINQINSEIPVINNQIFDLQQTLNNSNYITLEEKNLVQVQVEASLTLHNPNLTTFYNYVSNIYSEPDPFRMYLQEKYKTDFAAGTATFIE